MKVYVIRPLPPSIGDALVCPTLDYFTQRLKRARIGKKFEVRVESWKEKDVRKLPEGEGW